MKEKERLASDSGTNAGKTAAERNKSIALILFAAVLVCCIVLAAILVIHHLNGNKAPAQTASDAASEPEEEIEPLDMEKVKAEINSKQISDFVEADGPTNYVKLTIKDFGEIVVRLRPDVAPISVQNFQDLVKRGFYNGTYFHRVYPGFMIQGGAGTEELTPIKGEFSANGVENNLLHIRGVLSMARTTVKDSATSQFFLMHADYPSLNGNYAAFGYILAGLETVDKVCEIPLGTNPYSGEVSVPMVDVLLESAVFVKPK